MVWPKTPHHHLRGLKNSLRPEVHWHYLSPKSPAGTTNGVQLSNTCQYQQQDTPKIFEKEPEVKADVYREGDQDETAELPKANTTLSMLQNEQHAVEEQNTLAPISRKLNEDLKNEKMKIEKEIKAMVQKNRALQNEFEMLSKENGELKKMASVFTEKWRLKEKQKCVNIESAEESSIGDIPEGMTDKGTVKLNPQERTPNASQLSSLDSSNNPLDLQKQPQEEKQSRKSLESNESTHYKEMVDIKASNELSEKTSTEDLKETVVESTACLAKNDAIQGGDFTENNSVSLLFTKADTTRSLEKNWYLPVPLQTQTLPLNYSTPDALKPFGSTEPSTSAQEVVGKAGQCSDWLNPEFPYCLDQRRKRKRPSSGVWRLNSAHITKNLHLYVGTKLLCEVNIARSTKELGNQMVLKYVCALLNSGGGILHMLNKDAELGVVLCTKDLDTWWSGMENKMAEIMSGVCICNYFDFAGNHDDHHLYLFVKTAEHLCSVQYNCRLPWDTATHEVTYQSMLPLLVNHGEPGSLSELPPIPDKFILGCSAKALKKETKQIQFKQVSLPHKKSNFTLPAKIRKLMISYVSAFANHEGGRIYFGIDDARASVIGVETSQSDQDETEKLVGQRLDGMIWKDRSIKPVQGVHWDINFFPIQNPPRKITKASHSSLVCLVVISVCKFPGGVFTSCPISAYVSTNRSVAEFTFDQWKEASLNPVRAMALQDMPFDDSLSTELPEECKDEDKPVSKNKKKRDAKKAKKAKEMELQQGEHTVSSQPPQQSSTDAATGGPETSTGDPDKDKKIKKLRKKLQAVKILKEQQSAGKPLEKNQMEKLKTEDTLIAEIRDLELS